MRAQFESKPGTLQVGHPVGARSFERLVASRPTPALAEPVLACPQGQVECFANHLQITEEHGWIPITQRTLHLSAQLLVASPGKPWGCSGWASCHRSSTSKSVTGTQSLSSSTMWSPGNTKQRAARTKVPAQVE